MKYLYVFILGLIVGAVVCFRLKPTPTETITVTETIYDTIVQTIEKPISVVEEVFITEFVEVPVEVPMEVDTAAIVAEHLKTKVYQRVWEDSELSILMTDTITQNKLVSGTLDYQILRPTTINTTTVYAPKNYLTMEFLMTLTDKPQDYGVKFGYVGDISLSVIVRPKTNTFELGMGWIIKEW